MPSSVNTQTQSIVTAGLNAQYPDGATPAGSFTANGATAVVVANTAFTANTPVLFTVKTIGGTPAGAPYISSVTPGTGFSVKAAAGDTSVYNYFFVN